LKTSGSHRILIAPVGEFNPELVAAVGREVQRVFRAQIEVGALFSDLSFAFDAGRRQYHSTPILQRVAEASPPEVLKVLALTEVDLFIPILTHVYGEAQLGGKACIVSTHRLDSGPETLHHPDVFLSRMIKEAIHELGHTFNLRHCPEAACSMHYCRSEADVDRKSKDLCRYCRVMLDDELIRIEKSEIN
jgi:archaemetzincin